VLRGSLLALRHEGALRVDRPPASAAEREARRLLRDRVRGYVEGRAEATLGRLRDRWFGEALSRVPAGLPVLPPAAGWYFTANVWVVDVRGRYARFVVRADAGPGDAPGGGTRYVREDAVVRLDVDGDGDRERIGANEPVEFRTRTATAVAVTPTGTGVGDVDGVVAETAGAWPAVGCLSDEPCFPGRERATRTDDPREPTSVSAPAPDSGSASTPTSIPVPTSGRTASRSRAAGDSPTRAGIDRTPVDDESEGAGDA
jgi:hypothetical protein